MKILLRNLWCLLFTVLHLAVAGQNLTLSCNAKNLKLYDEVNVILEGELADFTQYATLPPVAELSLTSTDNSFDNSAPGKKIRIRQVFTFTCIATGDIEIGPAVIYSGSHRIYSNTISIHVGQDSRFETEGLAFIKCETDKKTYYTGECITTNVRLYWQDGYNCDADYAGGEGYIGFWSYPDWSFVADPFSRDSAITIKGKKYYSRLIAREFLFPNASGEMTMPVYYASGTLTKISDEDYTSSNYTTTVDLTSGIRKVSVTNLPAHDSLPGYNGDVGQLNIRVSLRDMVTSEWEPVTLTYKISGISNFNLMMAPQVDLPSGLRIQLQHQYDSTWFDGKKPNGIKTFLFSVIPEKAGDYKINNIRYTFFDTESGKYVTLQSDSFALHVKAGGVVNADTAVFLPDSFFSVSGKNGTVTGVITVSVFAVIGLALVLVLRMKKKTKEQLRSKNEQDNSDAEVETTPTSGQSMIQAQTLVQNASTLLQNGSVTHCVDTLFNALCVGIGGRTGMKQFELSGNNMRYRLGQKGFSTDSTTTIIDIYEELKLKRYTLNSTDFDAAASLIDRTKQVLAILS